MRRLGALSRRRHTGLPLAVRSLWPLPVLGATLAAAVVGDLLCGGLQLAGPLIALYTVARRHDRRASLVAAAVAAAALAPSVASRAPDSPLFAIAISVALVATWLIGVSALAARTTLRRDIA